MIKHTKKILIKSEAYSKASSLDFAKYPEKIGTIAADIAPKTKIKAIKSGTVNAA